MRCPRAALAAFRRSARRHERACVGPSRQRNLPYPGGKAGIFDATLEIAPGELVVCIGPSGCGKTTLLKLIAGFLRLDSGRVYLGGEDVTAAAVRSRECGIVFQSYALFPHMAVWENVAYPLRVRNIPLAERRQRAEAMLDMVGLGGFRDRLPAALSGGQQQRVALARALAFKPRALLLDEPLSALDATTRVTMRDEIRRIQKHQNIASLLITHDQDEALSLADRIAVMREGRLVQVATPQEIYDRPADAFVANFVGRANLIDGVAAAVRCRRYAAWSPRHATARRTGRRERSPSRTPRTGRAGRCGRWRKRLRGADRARSLLRRQPGNRAHCRARQHQDRNGHARRHRAHSCAARSGAVPTYAMKEKAMQTKRCFIAALASVFAAGVAAQTVLDSPELYSGEKALYEAARKEGMVVSFDTGPTWANWAAQFAAFKKRYPEVEIVYNDLGFGRDGRGPGKGEESAAGRYRVLFRGFGGGRYG